MSRLRLVTRMLRRCSSAALGLAFTLTLFAPLGANAVDGVIEINHVAALAGGITPGDTAGYPVTIDTHGSYRLTGDLLPATSGVRGIEVLSGPVTIDLNGFAIIGPGICVGINPSCSGTLLTVGIEVIANQSVRIQNGTLTGLLTGINVPNDPSVTNSTLDIDRVVIEGNSGTGVLLSAPGSSQIHRSSISRNQLGGLNIALIHTTHVSNTMFRSNVGFGITSTGSTSLIENSMIIGTSGVGLNSFFLSLPSPLLGYRAMIFSSNSTNIVGGTQLGDNVCSGSLCP